MIKVLMVTSSFLPTIGGAEIAVAELAKALERIGIYVCICAPESTASQKVDHEFSKRFRTPVRRSNFSNRIPFLSYNSRAIIDLLKIARSFDIIHAHFAYPSGFDGLVAGFLTSRPLIVTMHGGDIQISREANYGMRLNKWIDLFVRLTLRKADMLIAVSNAIASDAVNAGAPLKKIHVIPNGVDVHRFKPGIPGNRIRKKLGISADEYVVLMLSRFHPKKGHVYLMKAAAHVLNELPRTRFVLCGEGPEKNRIMNMAEDLGIERNVIFTGFVPEAEKPYYYAASDVFVMPSLEEACPLTLLESLAMGKPVIASKAGILPDIICKGSTGEIVDPTSECELADAITRYLREHSLRKVCRKIARNDVVKNFSWEKIAKKTTMIYERLI